MADGRRRWRSRTRRTRRSGGGWSAGWSTACPTRSTSRPPHDRVEPGEAGEAVRRGRSTRRTSRSTTATSSRTVTSPSGKTTEVPMEWTVDARTANTAATFVPDEPGIYDVKVDRGARSEGRSARATMHVRVVGRRRGVLRRRRCARRCSSGSPRKPAAASSRRPTRRRCPRRSATAAAASPSSKSASCGTCRSCCSLLLGLIGARVGLPPRAGSRMRRRWLAERRAVAETFSAGSAGRCVLLAAFRRCSRGAAARAGHASAGRSPASAATRSTRSSSRSGRRRSSTPRRSTAVLPTPTSPSSATSPSSTGAHQGRSTQDNVRRRSPISRRGRKPTDEVFIMLIGHGSFDGKTGGVQPAGPGSHRRRLRGAARQASDAAGRVRRTPRARAARSCRRWPGRGARSSPRPRPAASATRRGSREFFVEAFERRRRRPRSQRPRLGAEAFEYAKTKVAQASTQKGLHPDRARGARRRRRGQARGDAVSRRRTAPRRRDGADRRPGAARAARRSSDALEQQVAALRLKKDAMDPAQYDAAARKAADRAGAQDAGDPGAARPRNDAAPARRRGVGRRRPARLRGAARRSRRGGSSAAATGYDPIDAQRRRTTASSRSSGSATGPDYGYRVAAACLVARLPGRRAALHEDHERAELPGSAHDGDATS